MKPSLTEEWEILCSHRDISAVDGFRMYSKMRAISMGSGGITPRRLNRSPCRSNVQCYFVYHKSHVDWPRIDPGFGGYSLATDCQNRFLPHGKKLDPDRIDQSGNAVG